MPSVSVGCMHNVFTRAAKGEELPFGVTRDPDVVAQMAILPLTVFQIEIPAGVELVAFATSCALCRAVLDRKLKKRA